MKGILRILLIAAFTSGTIGMSCIAQSANGSAGYRLEFSDGLSNKHAKLICSSLGALDPVTQPRMNKQNSILFIRTSDRTGLDRILQTIESISQQTPTIHFLSPQMLKAGANVLITKGEKEIPGSHE